MNRLFQKILWHALGGAVLGCLLLDLIPHAQPGSRLARLPLKGLGLVGRDLSLNDAESKVFHRATVLKRIYQAGSNQFVLLAVDGAGNRHAIHDPLYCFRGAGWRVVRESFTTLPGGHGKVVHLSKEPQIAEAMYWITDGSRRHTSALRVWWQSLTHRFLGASDRNAPVLVLLQPVAGQTVDWQDLQERFPSLFEL